MSDMNRRGLNLSGQMKNPDRIVSVLLEAYMGKPFYDFTVSKTINEQVFKLQENYAFPVFGFPRLEDNNQAYFFGQFSEERLTGTNALVTKGNSEKERDLERNERVYKLQFFPIIAINSLNDDEKEKICTNPLKNDKGEVSYLVDANTLPGGQKMAKSGEVTVTYKNFICDKCNNKKETDKLYYCYNCDRHLCGSCKDKTHSIKANKTFSQHVITDNYRFKINYFKNCDIHKEIPYKFFEVINQDCFCPRCAEEKMNETMQNAAFANKIELRYIEDFLKEKDNQEDFLDSRIEEVCKDIDHLLKFSENVWNLVDEYETNFLNMLEKKKESYIKKMRTEGLARASYLACTYMELQRMIKDFDSKSIFIKNQRNNVDVATYLYMHDQYVTYIKEDMKTSFENISSFQSENFGKNIITPGKGENIMNFFEEYDGKLDLVERVDDFNKEFTS